MNTEDRTYMLRAIELAKAGQGWCHPNPMVGAVIVKDGKIIGEGYHQKCGELHAERNAIASLREPADGSTIYVTLEPCCHYGKTPPCTEAIMENRISRVVIGSRDPNPLVAGKGARILREAGIEVIEDFMREECDAINPVFFHYITSRTPYVIMKFAMTADGKIATRTGASKWITGEESRREVHRIRHACMGIMAGIGTVLADDPLLNCRLDEDGLPLGACQPIRIICDSHLRIPLDSQICRTADQYETILVCADPSLPAGEISAAVPDPQMADRVRALQDLGITVLNLPEQGAGLMDSGAGLPDQGTGRVDLPQLMTELGARGIDSILLEGGGDLNDSALRAGIVSEIRAFIAPKIFGGASRSPVQGMGVEHPSEAIPMELMEMEHFGDDIMLRFRVKDEKINERR